MKMCSISVEPMPSRIGLPTFCSQLRQTAAGKRCRHHVEGGSAEDDQWNGQWGVIRAYRRVQGNLLRLSTSRPVSSSLRAAALRAASCNPISRAESVMPIPGAL